MLKIELPVVAQRPSFCRDDSCPAACPYIIHPLQVVARICIAMGVTQEQYSCGGKYQTIDGAN